MAVYEIAQWKESESMEICYKGYEKGLVCREKQYQENTVFEEPIAEIEHRGMHYCPSPFDVLDHCDLINADGNFTEFTTVEPLGKISTKNGRKFCTTKMKIGEKLDFSEFVEACIQFAVDHSVAPSSMKTREDSCSVNCMIYDHYLYGNPRDLLTISSSGHYAKIGISGDHAQVSIAGDFSKVFSSGISAKISSSGYRSLIGSTGELAQISSSRNYCQIVSSGYLASICSAGEYSQILSTGNSASIESSGDFSQIVSLGTDAVVMCSGRGTLVKAKKGSWITLTEWGYDPGRQCRVPVCVKTKFVDGIQIKEDTFYWLKDGEFIEC